MTSPRVFQINLSQGGVPKNPVRQAQVNENGLAGDRQNDQVSHGGPHRALCLFSLELIQALQEEGHPVYPGALGENITLSGFDWASLVPGKKIQLGEKVLIEITSYTSPCKELIQSFIGGDIQRVSQKQNPGWSRVYARVLREGPLRAGDRVTEVS